MENISNDRLLNFIGNYGEGVSLDYKAEGYDISRANPYAGKKKKALILDLTAMANSNGKELAVIITGVYENKETNKLERKGIPKGKFYAYNYEQILRHASVDPLIRFEYREVEDTTGTWFGFFIIQNNIHRPYMLTKDLYDKFKKGLVPFRSGSSNDVLDSHIPSNFDIIERWKEEDRHIESFGSVDNIQTLESPHTFKSIDSFMNLGVHRKLFQHDLLFFTEKEWNSIEEIYDKLSCEHFSLLLGDPASGKTMTACKVASRFKEKGFQIYYHSFKYHTPHDLWNDIHPLLQQKVLFIIDDCHFDMEYAGNI